MDKIQKNNPVNDPTLKPVKGHSLFKPNYSLFTTQQFGLIQPHMVAEVVPDDKKVQFRSGTDIDTFSLKAPLMVPVNAHKDHFFVPMRAILPINADLVVTNPLTGDDVDASQVKPMFTFDMISSLSRSQLFSDKLQFCKESITGVLPESEDNPDGYGMNSYCAWVLAGLLYSHMYLAPFCSRGSLASNLGYELDFVLWPQDATNGEPLNYDVWFDRCVTAIAKRVKSFVVKVSKLKEAKTNPTTEQVTVKVSFTDLVSTAGELESVSFRRFLFMLSQGSCATSIDPTTIVYNDGYNQDTLDRLTLDELGFLPSYEDADVYRLSFNTELISSSTVNTVPRDFSRLVAYQLACIQFYTDDHIDYVYNCALWHQNMKALVPQDHGYDRYELNGTRVEYDSVSAPLLTRVFSTVNGGFNSGTIYDSEDPMDTPIGDSVGRYVAAYGYICNLMNMVRSLRYRDYFVGAKVAPLAVGDTDVAVNDNVVDVVDVTKNIQMQRFLNQVNRIGRSLKNYTQGIFGATPKTSPTEVVYLSSISWAIGAEETSNTGEAQLSEPQTITSKLRSDSSRFMFEMDANEFGVLIGVTYFDLPRQYVSVTDRPIFHVDRFDMYNPYLQHIGDQAVFGYELNPSQHTNFGYQLRYMEYKQRVDRAAGGFVSYLPGYANVAGLTILRDPLSSDEDIHIGPDFIRAIPSEMDKYYISLTHFSPAGYFHFIIRHDNQVNMLRPMEPAPSIL